MTLSGITYPITATIDALLWTYNFTCRRDSASGEFCAPKFDVWANGNGSDLGCSECVLGTYQLQLSNALGYDNELAGNFSSLASSCHAANYPVTSPPSNSLNSTATATTTSAPPEKSCCSNYTIEAGDDCHKISNAQRVSTNDLLYLNNLQGGCANFPEPGRTLCMPRTCEVYTVRANDTCSKITNSGNLTNTQLIAWNVDINRGCNNLDQLVGMQICISSPGEADTATAINASALRTQALQPTNPCVGGTTFGPPSCYATTYSTVQMWTFPKVSPMDFNTTTSASTTSHLLAPVTAYPVRPTGTAVFIPVNTTSYVLPSVTTYPVRSIGRVLSRPHHLYWVCFSILWIQFMRINK